MASVIKPYVGVWRIKPSWQSGALKIKMKYLLMTLRKDHMQTICQYQPEVSLVRLKMVLKQLKSLMSFIYLPLQVKDKMIGLITVQSFQEKLILRIISIF